MNQNEKTRKEIFCERLRDLRHKLRLNQENMADMLGMSASKYAKIEEGKMKVHLDMLEHFEKKLKVGLLYFLGLDGANAGIPPP